MIENLESLRKAARQIFMAGLDQSRVEKVFPQHVEYGHGALRIGEDLYSLDNFNRVFALSIGKAGQTLAQALVGQLGSRVSGIVVSPFPVEEKLENFRYFFGGHPVPNAESIRAAESVVDTLREIDRESLVIFMISGGGSAAMEKPLSDFISADDLIATYKALVLSGATIGEINAIRKHLSAVKGGRLALVAEGTQQVSILLSDVPPNTLDSLASGPTMPDSTTCSDCYEIAKRHGLLEKFPNSVREIFRQRLLEETPKSDEPAFIKSRWWTIASSDIAARAAAKEAKKLGFHVEIDNTPDDWDYQKAADYLLDRCRNLGRSGQKVCLISAGEVTVNVEQSGGVGGRNQQFALYTASKIAGENIAVLSAGTDGVDGNSTAAGAIADGTSRERGKKAGADVESALRAFDAFPFFEKLGDCVHTGPTGTNVRDLRLLLT